jgi:hypothetical protein
LYLVEPAEQCGDERGAPREIRQLHVLVKRVRAVATRPETI